MSAVSELKLGRVVQGAGSFASQQGSVFAPGIRSVVMLPQLDGLVP